MEIEKQGLLCEFVSVKKRREKQEGMEVRECVGN